MAGWPACRELGMDEVPTLCLEHLTQARRGAEGDLLALHPTVKRLHDRYAEQPGSYELVPGDPFAMLQQFATVTERYPGDETRTLVPLTRLVIELVAWARAAPEIKPGRN
jgi:hypothetical protein